jgi:hypothetical protein
MVMAPVLIRDLERALKRLKRRATSRASVWECLKRRPAGNLPKREIDAYIRAERESWGAM